MNPIDSARHRLAILGDPVSHSRSPQIHLTAYRMLGLADWEYTRIRVAKGGLDAFVDGLDGDWRGFSITMPLKAEALRRADRVSETARLTGAVNTFRLTAEGIEGWNTDVYGIVTALGEAGVASLGRILIIGAGATAGSVIAAASRIGATEALVAARRAEQVEELTGLAERFGVRVGFLPLAEVGRAEGVDLVVNTVPGHAGEAAAFPPEVSAAVPLFEVVYEPWPSPMAAQWHAVGGTVVNGLDMLLHQGVAQVRIFTGLAEDEAFPGEPEITEAMRVAIYAAPA